MFLRSISILVVLYTYRLRTADGYMCHKCASTDAVWNWVKYGLPVNQGDSIVSDDKCLVENKLKKDGDSCAGYCMTINITRTDDEAAGKTIAIVRDCQVRTRNLPDLLESDAPLCTSYEKLVNRRNVNITTCYCRGHYCNGLGFAEATRHSKALELPVNSIDPKESSGFPWFLVHLSLISFLS
ncbi:Protein quiver [Caenorhabditis elegans]|uniref:Protein quiver n=1 Tax=Caenorhabditis elegans TaxID=6239 RepID=Q9NAF3_CAEEL|nr:Protein quiver [Caenorhabditis elegans]CAB55048.3 Protein quiver [Caenorhabditis elegans]|eukprot:NP_506639.3 Uncharacterized protein CELE_Y50E8A.5 [Caenorhabditis elegans]